MANYGWHTARQWLYQQWRRQRQRWQRYPLLWLLILGAIALVGTVGWGTATPGQAVMPLSRPEGAAIAPVHQTAQVPVSDDPAEQVAPPGLRVEPGNAPIGSYLGISMRQELQSLMGRFESAFLMAATHDTAITLQASAPEVASDTPPETWLNGRSDQHPALLQSQQLLADWPQLMDRQAYREIRDRWLAARQALWRNFPVDRPAAQPEIRAIWLDRGTIVAAASRQRLALIFDRLAAAGINTVFLETINASYPIYPSRIAPQQNPLIRRWDPLAAAVELAHERNMELHAWIWVFAAGNQAHNRILNQPWSFLGPVIEANPSWVALDNRGSAIPRGQTKPFFDPANPEVRSYLLNLIEEIITHYAVDGIQLDYIRYPFQDPGANRTYGYGSSARRQFQSLTGVDPMNLTPRPSRFNSAAAQERQQRLWQQWTDFRIQQITSFVSQASRLVREKRPDIVLSTAVFAQSTHDRQQRIQQDWEAWAEQGMVDWIVLMSYAQDTRALRSLIHPWVVARDYSPTLIIPSIRLLNLSEAAILDQMQSLRDLPVPGYALFAVADVRSSFESLLARTQGNTAQPVPQKAPFATTTQRYRALQREWNWLITQGQLQSAPTLLAAWIEEVNDLGSALEALERNPSRQAVQQVRSRLTSLRLGLGTAMDLQMGNRDYRLETWRQRLVTLDHFLAYGEARL